MRGINRDRTRGRVIAAAGLIGLFLLPAEPIDAAPMADANNDGIVNGQDLLAWQSNLYKTGAGTPGDFNKDGIVNGSDLLMWQSQLYTTAPPTPPPNPQNAVANPEPISFISSLLGLGAVGFAIRRRDRTRAAPLATA